MHLICLYVHFLCLPKENEPKEMAAVHLIPQAGLPCAARKERTFRKVAPLRRIAFPLFTLLLGGVKRQK